MICWHSNEPRGCQKGFASTFLCEVSAMAAKAETFSVSP